MRRHAWAMGWILSVVAVVAAAVGGSATQPAGDRGVAWERYRMLITRNIFLQDRRRARETRPASTRPSVRSEENGLVLTGVGQIGPDRTAFFEDLGTGQTKRVSTGQALYKGKVVMVTLEGVEYEQDGAVHRIAIGQDLSGAAAVLSGPGATTRPGDGSAAGGATSGANADPVLERLRQRRAQEMR